MPLSQKSLSKKYRSKDNRSIIFSPAAGRRDLGALSSLISECFSDKLSPAVGKGKTREMARALLESGILSPENSFIGKIGPKPVCFYSLDFSDREPKASYSRAISLSLAHLGILRLARALFAYSPLFFKSRSIKQGSLHLVMLGVSQDFRGLGISKPILESAESIARENKFSQLSLDVVEQNARAISIYEKFGFKIVRTYNFPFFRGLCGFDRSYRMEKKILRR